MAKGMLVASNTPSALRASTAVQYGGLEISAVVSIALSAERREDREESRCSRTRRYFRDRVDRVVLLPSTVERIPRLKTKGHYL
jgi:hypothetical protein